MKSDFRFVVKHVGKRAASKMATNRRKEAASQSVFHTTRTRTARDDGFRRVMKTNRAGEKLGAKHIGVIHNGNDARLLVDVVRGRHAVAASAPAAVYAL